MLGCLANVEIEKSAISHLSVQPKSVVQSCSTTLTGTGTEDSMRYESLRSVGRDFEKK